MALSAPIWGLVEPPVQQPCLHGQQGAASEQRMPEHGRCGLLMTREKHCPAGVWGGCVQWCGERRAVAPMLRCSGVRWRPPACGICAGTGQRAFAANGPPFCRAAAGKIGAYAWAQRGNPRCRSISDSARIARRWFVIAAIATRSANAGRQRARSLPSSSRVAQKLGGRC